MNSLYLLTQSDNGGYDTYDSCVVVALTRAEALQINPEGSWDRLCSAWASKPEDVTVEYLGKANGSLEAGDVVCASFNAG